MKRRDILKYTALVTGAAVSAPLISSILSGCNADVASQASGYTLQFFNKEQYTLIQELVDIILPKTDSPSATDVGVHRVVDHMVGGVYNQEQRSTYKTGIDSLFAYLKASKFGEKDGSEKLNLMQQLLKSNDIGLKDEKGAFTTLKQQTVAYYLSTEEIGTKFLNYLPIPGEYDACITLEEAGGKAWAL